MKPLVTFIVPCYKLGHLLAQCVDSILAQTYDHLEVLILDDCSPDHTGEVARRYRDPRVRYIRNEPNLGHLRNYNKGISLARGKYLWLISADDCLRSLDVLDRYVSVMEANPSAGFVFCPAVGLEAGRETGLLAYSHHGDRDFVIKGVDFLPSLIEANTVAAASGMVRRACYSVSVFPLDMPYAGDWYLWSLFALHFDVAYLAEPMVCYRQHSGSMTATLVSDGSRVCIEDDIKHFWAVLRQAQSKGDPAVIDLYYSAIVREYAKYLCGPHRRAGAALSLEACNESIEAHARDRAEASQLRARVFARLADQAWWRGDGDSAYRFYRQSLACRPMNPAILSKALLARTGLFGAGLRSAFTAGRRMWQGNRQGVKNHV